MATRSNLTARERRIMQAFAETLMPRGGPFPIGAADMDACDYLDRMLGEQDAIVRRAMRYLIHQWNWLPVLYLRSGRTFLGMSEDGRLRFMDWLAEDRFFIRRINVMMFKFLLSISLYGDPRVEAALGYARHCLPAADESPEARS
jgi:hypothetical protein